MATQVQLMSATTYWDQPEVPAGTTINAASLPRGWVKAMFQRDQNRVRFDDPEWYEHPYFFGAVGAALTGVLGFALGRVGRRGRR